MRSLVTVSHRTPVCVQLGNEVPIRYEDGHPMRIAFLSTHPIQYQVPLFRALHQRPGVHVTALFCLEHGVRPTFDREFKQTIRYDVPLLEGYEHRFLRNVAPRPALSPRGMVNPEIIGIVARSEFDAVIVHGYVTVTANLAFATPRLRTKLLLRGESNLLGPRSNAKRALKHMALRAVFSRVDHFLAIGELNRAYYRSYGVAAQRITLAPYSVDNAFFSERAAGAKRDPEGTRKRLGLPEQGVLFVSAGKLIAKKRPLDLVEAFARADIAASAGLVFVGAGELSDALKARVSELGLESSVRVLGFRNQTELPEVFGACDALVLPSDFEPWGLVVNEALAAGAIAVVSDQVGAAPDLVADARCVFPVGDIDRLAGILRQLVFDPALLPELKHRAAERIATWGLEQTADGVLRGVESAMASAP